MDGVVLRKVCSKILLTPSVPPRDVAQATPEALEILPADFVEKHGVLPFVFRNRTLYVATSEPWNIPVLDEIGHRTGCRVDIRFVDEVPLGLLLEKLYGIPAPARFKRDPQPRPRTEPEQQLPERPPEDLMCEDTFQQIYQRTDEAGDDGDREDEPARETRREPPEAQRETRPERPQAPAEEPPPERRRRSRGERPARRREAAEREPTVELTETVQQWLDGEDGGEGRKAFKSVENARAALDLAGDTDQIGWVLARFCLSKARRVVLFTRYGDVWMGWTGDGEGVERDKVRLLMVPSVKGTIFELVSRTGSHFVGPLTNHPIHRRFLSTLGSADPASCGLFPVYHRDRVVLGMYLDGGAQGELQEDVTDVLLLAQHVPRVLERLVHEYRGD